MLGRLSEHGQMQGEYVRAIGVVIVAIAIFAFAYGIISQATVEQRMGIYYTDNTANSEITDNTYKVPAHWDNAYFTGDNRRGCIDNFAGTGAGTVGDNHYLQDNDNGTFWWYQTLTISDIYNETYSALVNFSYQVSDNSGLGGAGAWHVLKVILEDPNGDNHTVWDNSVSAGHIAADNNTWHSIENDVSDWVTETGDYTLYLYDNCWTVSADANTDNVVVRWDNAKLTIQFYERSMSEQIANENATPTTKIFVLMIVVGIVAGVALILREMEVI